MLSRFTRPKNWYNSVCQDIHKTLEGRYLHRLIIKQIFQSSIFNLEFSTKVLS